MSMTPTSQQYEGEPMGTSRNGKALRESMTDTGRAVILRMSGHPTPADRRLHAIALATLVRFKRTRHEHSRFVVWESRHHSSLI